MADVWKGTLSRPESKNPRELAFRCVKDSKALLQRLRLEEAVEGHRGCVNTLQWSESGDRLLSGSDDHRLIVAEPQAGSSRHSRILCDFSTSHRASIFSAKFLPGRSDAMVVSCSADGVILVTDLVKPEGTRDWKFTCHVSTTYGLLTVAGDPNSFLSCGEDGTVRWFDLRTKNRCSKGSSTAASHLAAGCGCCSCDSLLIGGLEPVAAMALNPMLPYYLAVGSADSSVRIFDRRMLSVGSGSGGGSSRRCLAAMVSRFTPYELQRQNRRVTSVEYRPDGQEVLVSYSSDHIYVFDPNDDDVNSATRLFVGKQEDRLRYRSMLREKELPPIKRIRLRGDWSDTGPNARPENLTGIVPFTRDQGRSLQQPVTQNNSPLRGAEEEQGAPTNSLMQGMTDALSRMLNDPSARLAIRSLGEREMRSARLRRFRQESAEQPEQPSNGPAEDNEGLLSNRSQSPTVPGPGPASGHSQRNENPADGSSVGQETPSGTQGSSTPASLNNGAEPSASDPSVSEEFTVPLPGPRQVVTNPGVPGVDLATGRRQRRIGMSGVPSVPFSLDRQRSDGSNCTWPKLHQLSEFEELRSSISPGCDSDQSNGDGDMKKVFIRQPRALKRLTGHRNVRTMMKEACWWGNNFILSGSECGHIFGWDRRTGELIMVQEADRHVVNCVQPHPYSPILASSGIDYAVKIWAPTAEQSTFDKAKADLLVQRNEIMLEETRDTITIPPTLIIRMLATLNQRRRGLFQAAGRLDPRFPERGIDRRENEDEGGPQDGGDPSGSSSGSGVRS